MRFPLLGNQPQLPSSYNSGSPCGPVSFTGEVGVAGSNPVKCFSQPYHLPIQLPLAIVGCCTYSSCRPCKIAVGSSIASSLQGPHD